MTNFRDETNVELTRDAVELNDYFRQLVPRGGERVMLSRQGIAQKFAWSREATGAVLDELVAASILCEVSDDKFALMVG